MKEMSADLAIPYKRIREIVINGQSAFTKHIIESGSYDGYRWPHLGAFKVKARYMQVKKYMTGMLPPYRNIFRQQIKNGYVFPRKYQGSNNLITFDETLQAE